MNWFALTLGGVLLGTAVYLILNQQSSGNRGEQPPVEELAHRLEQAWADHHTTA